MKLFSLPDRITVVTDVNEKQGWKFPPSFTYTPAAGTGCPREITVECVVERLLEGDYTVRGWERVVAIERKGSLNELRTNLFTADRARFMRAILRLMKSTKHPILGLDIPLISTTYRLPEVKGSSLPLEPGTILDEVYRLVASLHRIDSSLTPLELMWVGGSSKSAETKWATGVQMLRVMWSRIVAEIEYTESLQKGPDDER